MITKKFNQKLHNENDPKARKKAKEYFEKVRKLEVREHTDKYSVDLILKKDGDFYCFCDVERRSVKSWNAIHKYRTLNIPRRKEKWLLGKNNFIYFSMNFSLTEGYLVGESVILDSPIKENPNKYVQEKEFFYSVLLERCIKVKI